MNPQLLDDKVTGFYSVTHDFADFVLLLIYYVLTDQLKLILVYLFDIYDIARGNQFVYGINYHTERTNFSDVGDS